MAAGRSRDIVRYTTAALVSAMAIAVTAGAQDTVAITEFLNNPNGGVGGIGDAGLEFVELFNYGSSDVDLTGFTIFDQGAGGGSGSFEIPSLVLAPGEYALFLGTQSFGGNRQSESDLTTGFFGDYFGGTTTFADGRENRLFTLSTTNPGDGLEDSVRALGNAADEIFLGNSAGQVVWNVAYGNDEAGGVSTFLARDQFDVTSFGDIDNPGINRSGPDNGSLTDVFYIQNGATVLGTSAGQTTLTETTFFDPALGETPTPTPAGNIATPFEGFYTLGGGSGLGPADGFTVALPELTATVTVNQSSGATVGSVETGATQTQEAAVKLVISGVADTVDAAARVIELTALDNISAEELGQYGVSALNNGSSFLAVEAGNFDLGRDIAAGEKLYLVEDEVTFSNNFAEIDFNSGSTTPFPTSNIIATDTGATALNGDDQIVLFINGQEVDSVGVFDEDGTGTPWEHEDGYIYRNDNVLPTFEFDVSDFTVANNEFLDDDTGIGLGIVPDGSTFATVFGEGLINGALESPRLALVDNATGEAVDANGDPVVSPGDVVLADRTPFPIGTYDGSGIAPGDLPTVETDVAGEYFFAQAVLDTPLAAGSVDVSGYVPLDDVFVGFDVEFSADSPDLNELLSVLTSSGATVTNLTEPTANLPGVSDNELYDDFEFLVELQADSNGDFTVDWDFSLFSLVGGFADNPLVNALAFGTVEAVVDFLLGDLNGDDLVNNGDINPFVLALTDANAYAAAFPDLDAAQLGDINLDGAFNNGDINAFIDLLTGGGLALSSAEFSSLQAVPEPTSLLTVAAFGGLVLTRRRRRS